MIIVGSLYNGYLKNFISALEKKLGKKLKVKRIKINLNPKDVPENKGSCFHPHVDIEKGGGWTGIYFVNESDGDTVIFDMGEWIT